MMCRRLYLGQVRRGNHAHIEHPERSKAWSTSAFKTLPGYHTVFDQCAYGATTKDDNGYDAFIRKSTALHTTKHAMAMRMSRRCEHTHDHQPLEGRIPGTSISRCRAAEEYCLTLAQHFVHGMMAEETLDDQVYAADEAEAQHNDMRQLAAEHGDGPARVAIKLHRNRKKRFFARFSWRRAPVTKSSVPFSLCSVLNAVILVPRRRCPLHIWKEPLDLERPCRRTRYGLRMARRR